jgi:hypothetical protein
LRCFRSQSSGRPVRGKRTMNLSRRAVSTRASYQPDAQCVRKSRPSPSERPALCADEKAL